VSDEDLVISRDAGVLRIEVNRPARRNAVTFAMYDRLGAQLAQAAADPGLRAVVLASTTDGMFIAGTDITEFRSFTSGSDGVAYERRMTALLDALEDLPVPTVAVVTGACVGGGLALASACDLRIASRTAVFGLPIARTVGNCLSAATHALLQSHFGPSRVKDMVLAGRTFTAADASAFGYVNALREPGETEAELRATLAAIGGHAPLTMWSTKRSLRLLRTAALPDDTEILTRVYGSEDFARGVAAFAERAQVDWHGH
jgi:enoyl-CoA hydratase/carnithine racemase